MSAHRTVQLRKPSECLEHTLSPRLTLYLCFERCPARAHTILHTANWADDCVNARRMKRLGRRELAERKHQQAGEHENVQTSHTKKWAAHLWRYQLHHGSCTGPSRSHNRKATYIQCIRAKTTDALPGGSAPVPPMPAPEYNFVLSEPLLGDHLT